MTDLYAQGDILIERVDDVPVSGEIMPSVNGEYVLAEGELTGHRHAIRDNVTMFRDDGLARDLPPDLYVAHLKVIKPTVLLEHEEHAPIALTAGTYRVRRQRELEAMEVSRVAD